MKLIRQPSTKFGTFGTWFNDDKSEICKTVELPWANNVPHISCIPVGLTVFNKYISPVHGHVWMAQDVIGRSDCELHSANFWFQLLGCLGVGDSFGQLEYYGDEYPQYSRQNFPAVLNSVNTLNMLRATLPDTFSLDISWNS